MIPCDLLFQASALLSPSDAEEEHSSESKSPRQTPVQIILICSFLSKTKGPFTLSVSDVSAMFSDITLNNWYKIFQASRSKMGCNPKLIWSVSVDAALTLTLSVKGPQDYK